MVLHRLKDKLNIIIFVFVCLSFLFQVIEVMETAYHRSVVFFRLGTLCYLFGTIFASFCLFSPAGGLLLSAVLSLLLYYLLQHLKTLKLKFVPTKFNSGEMRGNPIKNIAGLMTRGSDLSLSGLHLDPEFCNKI